MSEQDTNKNNSDLIWSIANLLRGPYRPPQYRRVMIPLVVLRRLDCVLEATKADVLNEYARLKSLKEVKTGDDGEKVEKDKYSEETIEKMIFRKYKLQFTSIP